MEEGNKKERLTPLAGARRPARASRARVMVKKRYITSSTSSDGDAAAANKD